MISAVSRALALLEELSEEPEGLTAAELVMRLKVDKSVVSRVLATLEADGYVLREESTGVVRMGLAFAGIALRHVDAIGVPELCVPLLREVATKTRELIQLAIVQNDQIVYVAKADGPQRIRVLSMVGRAAVFHASAAGKVWLASLPEERALGLALGAGLERFTAKTITDIDLLRAEMARVRDNDYAIVQEELIDGASTVAVPVRNKAGDHVIGAIVLSGPSYRLPKRRLVNLVDVIRPLAEQIGNVGNIESYCVLPQLPGAQDGQRHPLDVDLPLRKTR